MTIRHVISATVAALTMSACGAMQRPPAPSGDPSVPRLGWVIMHGSGDNPDEEFVCQSSPRSACALPVSTASRKVFSEVHLYFHPTGTPAKYEGTVQVEFFDAARPLPIALAVDPGKVGNNSIVGIVTDKPGEYALNVSATTATPNGPQRVTERVPVVVK